jgi:serine/threonine protein kinase
LAEVADSPVQIGALVAGKYRVDRVLGTGGMGVVLAATHEAIGQRVALKFLHTEVAAHEGLVERFRREARAAAAIHSEHVARVYDVGVEAGAPFLVMEYLEGEDLAAVLARRGPLPIVDTIDYVLQAAEAIAEAHAANIVHRDLKPSNLFLANRKSGAAIVKVLDFGISKFPASDTALTSTSALLGTPGYMSPEQMVAVKTVDARSDIFSIGLILFILLTGRLAFEGETLPELIAKTLQIPHPPARSLRPDIPDALSAVIDRCLEKMPAGRYPNIAELARALIPFGPPHAAASYARIASALGVSVLATTESSSPAFASSNPQSPSVAPSAPSLARDLSRAPPQVSSSIAGPLIAIAVLAMLALGGAGVWVWNRKHHQPMALASSTPSASLTSPTATMSAPEASEIIPDIPPSAIASATVAPSASASSSQTKLTSHPSPKASASAAAPSASSSAQTPACHRVTWTDESGNTRFREECR